jgi:short-subunit dehydrogenase
MGTTALVTGASAGIGRCYAEQLARRGHDLVLIARSAETLTRLAEEFQSEYGVTVLPIEQDLSIEGAARVVLEGLRERDLQVDILVNNAGFGSVGDFRDLSLERELAMIRLNIGALVALTGLLLPEMVKRGRGEIVNVSSVIASHPSPGFAVYAATKEFVTSFSTALAVELAGTGVNVQALHPGSTATNFQVVAGSEGGNRPGQQTAEQVVRASLRGMDERQRVVVSGLVNRLVFPVFSALPASLAARISGRLLNHSAALTKLPDAPSHAEQLAD